MRLLRLRGLGPALNVRPARFAGRTWSVLIALALAGSALVGCQGAERAPDRPGRQRAVQAELPPREAGLAAIDATLIAQDVAFLASDELEGRDTPSRGLRIAARYIRNRLETLGFEHGADGGWFYEWLMVERELTPERIDAELNFQGRPESLELGRNLALHYTELVPVSFASGLVWCGAGTRDDFRGLDLSGQIAICREGSESRARRRKRAAEANAGCLLVLAEPDSDEVGPNGEDLRFAEWTERLAKASYSVPRQDSGRLPTFWISGDLAARLAAAGAELEPGAPLDADFKVSVDAHRDVGVENVCAFWPGSNPELADEVILVSAHYDHVGIRKGQIYNGADDNASGSSAMLALAESLAAHGPLERSVLLLWVSGEEKGLWGSAAWAKNPWLPEGTRAICNINFDMVGRNGPGVLEFTPTTSHKEHNGLAQRVVRLAPLEGFDELYSADRDFERSDHASFAKHLEVPVLYVSAGEHADYHQPTDTADKIDNDKVARFTRLVFRLLLELQDPELALEFDHEPVEEPEYERFSFEPPAAAN